MKKKRIITLFLTVLAFMLLGVSQVEAVNTVPSGTSPNGNTQTTPNGNVNKKKANNSHDYGNLTGGNTTGAKPSTKADKKKGKGQAKPTDKEKKKNTVDGAKEEAKKSQKKLNKENYFEPKEVKQGGVVLKGSRFPIDQYTGYADIGAVRHPIRASIKGIGNALFYINNMLWQMFDSGINMLSTTEVVNDQLDKIDNVASDLWTQMSDYLLPLILLIVVGFSAYTISIKNDLLGGLGQIGQTVLVFVVGGVFLANAVPFLKGVNEISGQVQGQVLETSQVFSDDFKDIDQANVQAGTTAILRNTLFEDTVYRPYMLMNYGTTNEAKILKGDKGRIDRILKQKKPKNEVKKEADKKKNAYMSDGEKGVNGKISIGIFSPFMTILLGTPMLLLSMFNLIIQVGIIGMFLMSPLAFLVGLLPWFGNSGFKTLGTLIGMFFYKAFTALFILFALLLTEIVDSVVSPNNIGGYLLNTVVLAVLMWTMIVKRDWVIGKITAGRVQSHAMSGMLGAGATASYAISRKLHNNNSSTNNNSNKNRPTIKQRANDVKEKISQAKQKRQTAQPVKNKPSLQKQRANYGKQRQQAPQMVNVQGQSQKQNKQKPYTQAEQQSIETKKRRKANLQEQAKANNAKKPNEKQRTNQTDTTARARSNEATNHQKKPQEQRNNPREVSGQKTQPQQPKERATNPRKASSVKTAPRPTTRGTEA